MPRVPKYYVRPDGLHETILRINGKRKAFRGKTDAEVYRKVKEYREELAHPKAYTFSEAADSWWEEIEPTLAYNSTKNYKPAYLAAQKHFADDPVDSITVSAISLFLDDMKRKGYKLKTVNTYRQIVRQILAKAERDGHIQYNPGNAVQLPKGLEKQKRSAPDKEQIKLIKSSVDDPFGLFAFLVYYTGCRRGEAEALRYDDIDRKNNMISISRSCYYDGETAALKQPKSDAGVRTVPLLKALKDVLPADGKGYIFSEDGGKSPLKKNRFERLYQGYKSRTGVTATPHEIRHGYASALYEAKVDIKTAQELLGHAQISTTMDIYTDLYDDAIKRAAKKMDKAF